MVPINYDKLFTMIFTITVLQIEQHLILHVTSAAVCVSIDITDTEVFHTFHCQQ